MPSHENGRDLTAPPSHPTAKRDDSSERSAWVCVPAVAWVLDEAPDVPASLVATLVGLARHADENGRNAFPSEAALARYTRKTVRQVRRDLAELVSRGLIRRPVDQDAASGIRGDRRPTVYDLAFAPDRADDRTPATGRQRPTGHPRPDVDDQTTGHEGQDDRTPASSEEALKKPEQAAAAPDPVTEEQDGTTAALAARLDVDYPTAARIVAEVERRRSPGNLGGYLRALSDADLRAFLAPARPPRAASTPTAGRLQLPCGQCDARPGDPPTARIEWLDDDRTRSRLCPRCHPARQEVSPDAA